MVKCEFCGEVEEGVGVMEVEGGIVRGVGDGREDKLWGCEKGVEVKVKGVGDGELEVVD